MIPQRKWPILLFHTSILIILIGAGVTRYFGFEGVMHIRENNASNSFLSSNSFLKFNVSKGGQSYDFEEPVLFASLGSNKWHESYLLGEDLIEIKVTGFIPNPKQRLVESINGKPTLQLVIAGLNGREEYFIHQGQTKRIRNLVFNFKETQLPNAFNIVLRNDSLLFSSDKTFTQTVMATQQKDTIIGSNTYNSLFLRSLYSDGFTRPRQPRSPLITEC